MTRLAHILLAELLWTRVPGSGEKGFTSISGFISPQLICPRATYRASDLASEFSPSIRTPAFERRSSEMSSIGSMAELIAPHEAQQTSLCSLP